MSARQGLGTLLYSCALRAFPSSHRAEFRPEMVESFEHALAAHRLERGRLRAAGFAVAASLDAVVAGWGERRRRVARTGHAFTGFGRDLRHAARALAQARTFSAVCVISLGLGLGAVFAIWMFTSSLTAIPQGIQPDRLVEIVIQPQGPLRAAGVTAVTAARATAGLHISPQPRLHGQQGTIVPCAGYTRGCRVLRHPRHATPQWTRDHRGRRRGQRSRCRHLRVPRTRAVPGWDRAGRAGARADGLVGTPI